MLATAALAPDWSRQRNRRLSCAGVLSEGMLFFERWSNGDEEEQTVIERGIGRGGGDHIFISEGIQPN